MHFLCIVLILVFLLLSGNAEASCPAVRKCLASEECTILPVPKASLPSPIAPVGFNLTKLRSGVYSWTEGSYISLILYKNQHLALIDFPIGPSTFRDGNYLLNVATAEVLNGERPKRVSMVYGHRHVDHIGGSPFFHRYVKQNFPSVPIFVWATKEVLTFLARNPKSQIPKPTVLVGEFPRTVNLAPSLNVKLSVLGGHVSSDLVAHVLPSSDGPGIAHYVDVITPGFVPFIEFGFTIDLGRYISAQEELLKMKFRIFSGGHGRLGLKKDIVTNIAYTKDVLKIAEETIEKLTPERLAAKLNLARAFDPTQIQFGNSAWVTIESLKLAAKVCSRNIIKRWGCTLGSVAVLSPSHCTAALVYLSVEVE